MAVKNAMVVWVMNFRVYNKPNAFTPSIFEVALYGDTSYNNKKIYAFICIPLADIIFQLILNFFCYLHFSTSEKADSSHRLDLITLPTF